MNQSGLDLPMMIAKKVVKKIGRAVAKDRYQSFLLFLSFFRMKRVKKKRKGKRRRVKNGFIKLLIKKRMSIQSDLKEERKRAKGLSIKK